MDRLKIDRAFVKDIPDGDDGVIATSIVALSKAIGLKVLAEGVETQRQLDFLKSIDCDEIQGYFFSRPVEADEVAAFFATKASLHLQGKILWRFGRRAIAGNAVVGPSEESLLSLAAAPAWASRLLWTG